MPSAWQKMSEAPYAHRGGRRQDWATRKPERLLPSAVLGPVDFSQGFHLLNQKPLKTSSTLASGQAMHHPGKLPRLPPLVALISPHRRALFTLGCFGPRGLLPGLPFLD